MKIPAKWKGFLSTDGNKKALMSFLLGELQNDVYEGNGCEKALRTMTLFEHEGQRSLVITEFTIHLFSLYQSRSYKAKEGRKTGIGKSLVITEFSLYQLSL